MADTKISQLTALSPVEDTDLVVVVDVSDTTMAATGTTKKAFKSELKGDKGDTGTAATCDAGTTTTGAAGTDASVTNVGSTSAAEFNFVIPRGDKGETGETGATGASLPITLLTATGTVDDANTTFTFASEPTVVVVNGATYRNGKGVTIITTTVTTDYPVGTGGDIFGLK